MENFDDGIYVNCENVVKSQECLAVTRLLAADLIAKPYLTVGDFLSNISDSDLQVLVEGSETNESDEVLLDDLMLIMLMLRQAEGLEALRSDEKIRENLGALILFLVGESLSRKGLVKVYRDKMSFGEDMSKETIMEKI